MILFSLQFLITSEQVPFAGRRKAANVTLLTSLVEGETSLVLKSSVNSVMFKNELLKELASLNAKCVLCVNPTQ